MPVDPLFDLEVCHFISILAKPDVFCLKVSIRGPGEVNGSGHGNSSGHLYFRACFRTAELEYSDDLMKNVLADASGAAFDRWIHTSVLHSFDLYNKS
jgi:hypothetical protein